ncbi:TipAS antibiotic-recognition domain-containing protein [Bacillaceae bacterium W0354]
MDKNEMFNSFDISEIEEHQKKYSRETEEKYGHTDAYKESQRRTSQYGEKEWKKIKEESDNIYKDFVSLMDHEPSDEAVLDVVQRFQNHISTHFYECNLEILRGLGNMYIDDPRFTKNLDQYREGLAAFMREAFHAYCDKMEAK